MAHTVLTQSFYAIPSDVTLNFWSQPNAEMLCRLLMNICLTAISNLQFLAILTLNHIHSLHLWPSATFNYLNCPVCFFLLPGKADDPVCAPWSDFSVQCINIRNFECVDCWGAQCHSAFFLFCQVQIVFSLFMLLFYNSFNYLDFKCLVAANIVFNSKSFWLTDKLISVFFLKS